MSIALYRKHRPQTFADVTDQHHVKITLQNEIITGHIAHAYLFAGPRGVGKTTIARLLARAVNCKNRAEASGEPCNACDLCNESKDGRAIDVIEMDAASNTGVDNVRENIIESVRFAPSRGGYKVFIIDEAHMLSTSAFNALLKTLEEPPAHAIFILATTELHKVPETILSRCQRFDFHRVSTSDIVMRLRGLCVAEGVKVAEEVLEQIARLAEGGLRDAESLLGQILALGEKEINVEQASLILPVTNTATVLATVDALSRQDPSEALTTVAGFIDQGGSIRHLIDEMTDFIRTMLFLSLKGPVHDHYDAHTMQEMRRMLERVKTLDLTRWLDRLIRVRSAVAPDAFPQLPLEVALVELCFPPESGSVSTAPKISSPPPIPTKPIPKVQGSDVVRTPSPEPIGSITSSAPIAFSIDDLFAKWGRCCDALARRNVALPLVLRAAKPISIEGSIINISFGFAFHFETAKNPKNATMIAESIAEIIGQPVTINCLYEPPVEEKVAEELAEAFGGSVVL